MLVFLQTFLQNTSRNIVRVFFSEVCLWGFYDIFSRSSSTNFFRNSSKHSLNRWNLRMFVFFSQGSAEFLRNSSWVFPEKLLQFSRHFFINYSFSLSRGCLRFYWRIFSGFFYSGYISKHCFGFFLNFPA